MLVSLGDFLVLTPDSTRIGVSRKIVDETERARLKQIIEELKTSSKS